MAKVMVATSIRLEPEVHERLMAIASGRGVSVSSLLRAAIDRVVEEETEGATPKKVAPLLTDAHSGSNMIYGRGK